MASRVALISPAFLPQKPGDVTFPHTQLMCTNPLMEIIPVFSISLVTTVSLSYHVPKVPKWATARFQAVKPEEDEGQEASSLRLTDPKNGCMTTQRQVTGHTNHCHSFLETLVALWPSICQWAT